MRQRRQWSPGRNVIATKVILCVSVSSKAMLTTIIIGGIISYILIGAWTFGYVSGLDGRGEECSDEKYKGLYYYRDEHCAWWPAIFWPGALLYFLAVKPIARLGYQQGTKSLKVRKVRIELEKRIRVEQQRIEDEAEEEIEEALRQESAA